MQSVIGEKHTIYSYSTGDILLTLMTFSLITLSHPVTLWYVNIKGPATIRIEGAIPPIFRKKINEFLNLQ